MADLILGIPIELLDGVTFDANGENYTEAELRVNNTGLLKSAFGELIVAEPSPVIQEHFVYGIPKDWQTFTATGGAVTFTDENLTVCTTGTSVGGYGVSRSNRAVIYRAGEANSFKITAIFDSANAVANSRQTAGAFNLTDGFHFGYNGTEFGVLHEYFGKPEIQTLTVSAGASGNETLTITIAAVEYTVNVTSGTANDNAHEIEVSLESQVSGWRFDHIGDTVICQAETAATQTNDFTLVNETGGGTCAGTFAQDTIGQAKTTDWIAQADWNGETLGFTLDPAKLNIYKMDFGYLGGAGIKYYVMNPDNLEWKLCHTLRYANMNTQPLFWQPSMRVGWVAASLGSTTNITVKGCSTEGATDGERGAVGRTQSRLTTATISNTLVNVLSIRTKKVFGNKPNQGEIIPLRLSLADAGSSKGVEFEIFLNATVSGATNHLEHASDSIAIYNEDVQAITGNGAIEAVVLAPGESQEVDLIIDNIYLLQGEELVIGAKSLASGSPSDDVTVAITWREDI